MVNYKKLPKGWKWSKKEKLTVVPSKFENTVIDEDTVYKVDNYITSANNEIIVRDINGHSMVKSKTSKKDRKKELLCYAHAEKSAKKNNYRKILKDCAKANNIRL